MYVVTIEEVVQNAVVITNTLLIHSTPTVALFDSGSTHTFIAKLFFDRIGVSVEDLRYDLVVSTLAETVHTTGVCPHQYWHGFLWSGILLTFSRMRCPDYRLPKR